MRHLGSVLLALLLAPLGFVLTGRGLGGLAEVASEAPQAEQTDYFAIVTASAALGLAGLMLSLLTMARLSPLGPALAGVGYLSIGIWALTDGDRLLDAVPVRLVGLDDDRFALAATVAPLLAVPLLVTLFIPRRWRGRERPPAGRTAVYDRPAAPPGHPRLSPGPLPVPPPPPPRPLSPPPPSPPPWPVPPPSPRLPQVRPVIRPPTTVEPTTVLRSDEPTQVPPSEEPTEVAPSDEPTVTVRLPPPTGNSPATGG